ncbi:hypothetical protein Leryth_009259 [Lithospermum erythrorhizon]|uniref:Uncharacterized protein n=1 Tax=Lithospermum erythrorhizon TaxID=34254 RepID=A0AAV3PXR1_LITER|nr:hypothetical protein Leryth_009259 [Lithospermum erythrorhizon]
MARFLIVLALCMLPAIVSAAPFHLVGKCYCDTCRVGFETDASEYLPGSIVKLECKSRESQQVTYTDTAVTDRSGSYKFLVDRDFGDDVCDVILVKSSHSECSVPNGGRDRARVILTRNNGMVSDVRYANNLGFLKNTPLAACPQILQKYQDSEDV